MELEWKKSIEIPDGKQTGKIVKIIYREEPFEYTDVIVEIDGFEEIQLKYGCPTILSENSKLGRLIQNFGIPYQAGIKIDIDNVLVGKEVEFMTITRRNKEGKEYSEIVAESLKPKIVTQKV